MRELRRPPGFLDARRCARRKAARLLSDPAARATRGFVANIRGEPGQQSRHRRRPPPRLRRAHRARGRGRNRGPGATLLYEGKRCIHSRYCVTWGPKVFLANVAGPWIHPDAMDAERLVEIAHVCPSGAIRYRRKDGKPEEQAPLVNLIAIREGGPYAVRADLRLDGQAAQYRARQPPGVQEQAIRDGSHHEVHPRRPATPTGKADMLPAC
jgi:uncharacterized Fe-S cluster protein YjdI